MPSESFLLFEKLSEVRKLTTFYLAKNDHQWVTFISLKTINRFHHCGAIVLKRHLIAYNYVTGMFLVDVVATVPWDKLFDSTSAQGSSAGKVCSAADEEYTCTSNDTVKYCKLQSRKSASI